MEFTFLFHTELILLTLIFQFSATLYGTSQVNETIVFSSVVNCKWQDFAAFP